MSDQSGNNLAKLGDGVLEPVNSSESNILHKATVSNRIEHCWVSKIAIRDSPVTYMILEKLSKWHIDGNYILSEALSISK